MAVSKKALALTEKSLFVSDPMRIRRFFLIIGAVVITPPQAV